MTDAALPPTRVVRAGAWSLRAEEALSKPALAGAIVAAAERPDTQAGAPEGRGAHGRVDLGGGVRVIVRRYRHGGLLADLTGDRFLGNGRFLNEFRLGRSTWAAGVPTARPVAVGWRGGTLSTRGFIATLEIPEARDLLDFFAKPVPEAGRIAAAGAVARAVRSLHDAGVRHADLHLKNLLVGGGEAGQGPAAWVIDLDRARGSRGPLPERDRTANLARLYRSVEKHRRRGLAIGEAEAGAFCDAYFGDDGAGRARVRAALRRAGLRARMRV